MSLRFRCVRKALSHRASHLWKRPKTRPAQEHRDENQGIDKYLETAEKLGISVTALGFGAYELRKGNITRRLTSSLCLDRENVVTYKLCGNKYLTYKILLEHGVSCVPRHQLYTFDDVERTCGDFVAWRCPVVIKPCSGTSGGTGVTVNITTLKDLKNAICESFLFDRRAYLMEQFIEGSHFRVVTLRGEVVACIQRTPARVVGNGRDTIGTLIRNENRRRSTTRGEDALYPIVIDNEVRRKLRSMHKSMASVPAVNEELYVRDTVNLHAGGEDRAIDRVGADVERICRAVAEIMDIYLAGFDIITSDISKPLEETKGVINEVNTSPGMERMYRLTPPGPPVHVVELVLRDMCNLQDVPCGTC
jgi:cyanophycin synthetase